MDVVGEAGDAETARRRASGLKPSVLVLDLNMPGGAEPRVDSEGPANSSGRLERR
jgi:DNA-binding NarL/FixJ family response regulator